MAKEVEQLILQMSADIRKMEKGLAQAQGKFDKTARIIEARQRELDKNLSKLGEAAGQGLGRLSLAAGVAFGAIAAYAVKAAADAAEIQNAFEVAFGAAAGEAKQFADSLAKNVGRSVTDVQSAMSRLQLVLTGMGLAGDEALKITEALSARAIDIGSLWNVDDAQAFQSIISGISGEAEPMKKFGAVINETAVKAELLRLGFKGNAEQASDAAKAIARANLILQKTSTAAGDASRTIGSTANQLKVARAEFDKAAIELGRELLPAFTSLISKTADLVREFSQLPESVKLGGLALLGLVAASGPIAATIAGLARLITIANKARLAMLALAGANAGAGAAGGAGALSAAAAGGFGLGAGLTTAGVALPALALGISSKMEHDLRRVVAGPMAASDKELAAAQDMLAARYRSFAKSDIFEFGRRGKLVPKANAQPAARKQLEALNQASAVVNAELARREAVKAAGIKTEMDAASTEAIAGMGSGFGLNAAQQKAAGGSKGSKAKADKAARESAQQLERFNSEMARAHDRELAVQQLLNLSIDDRLGVELDRIQVEKAAREEELERMVQNKDLTRAQADALAVAEERARAGERFALTTKAEEDLAEEQLRNARALADIDQQILGIEFGAARTIKARREIAERMLRLEQKAEREALDADLARNPNLTDAEKDQRRGALGARQARQTAALPDGFRSPLEQFLADVPRSVDEVNESFERMAANGLEALNEGLVDAIFHAEDLGDVVRNVFRQMAADIISMTIKQNITGPIAALIKGKIPGFASGTSSAPGGLALVGERGPELVNLPRGSQVISNAALRRLQTQSPAGGAGGVTQVITFDNRGAMIWEHEVARFQSYADNAATRAAIHGAQGGRQLARADLMKARRRAL